MISKKSIALILCLIMCVSCLSLVSYAKAPEIILPDEGRTITFAETDNARMLNGYGRGGTWVEMSFWGAEIMNLFGKEAAWFADPASDITALDGALMSFTMNYSGSTEGKTASIIVTDVPIKKVYSVSEGKGLRVCFDEADMKKCSVAVGGGDIAWEITDAWLPYHIINPTVKAGTAKVYNPTSDRPILKPAEVVLPAEGRTITMSSQTMLNGIGRGGTWVEMQLWDTQVENLLGKSGLWFAESASNLTAVDGALMSFTMNYTGSTAGKTASIIVTDVPIKKSYSSSGGVALRVCFDEADMARCSTAVGGGEIAWEITDAWLPYNIVDPTVKAGTATLYNAVYGKISYEVTVDDVTVAATEGAAVAADNTLATVDANGDEITYPTVADALYAAGKLGSPESGRQIVKLDGKVVANPDLVYVKEGDTITTEVYQDGFAPISLESVDKTLGTDDSVHIKFCFSPDVIPNADAQTGIHLNGVLRPRMAGSTMKLGTMNGYVLFNNCDLTSYAQSASRIDYLIQGIAFKATVAETHVLDDEDNILGIAPDMFTMAADGSSGYEWGELFITDKYTTSGIAVFNNGTHYLLETDGCEDVVIIRSSESGITSENALITFTNPKAISVAKGEKVFVWHRVNYGAYTTLEPLCEAIVAQ